jgi:UDP-2-acetamido-3-amino-2,3-dideoxy-glucuronate N-acetyltransferase
VPQKAEEIAIDLKDIWEEPLRAECRAFLTAVETNTKPLTSGEEGLKVLKILELSQHSLEQKEQRGTTEGKLDINGDILGNREAMHKVSPLIDVFIHPTAMIDDNVKIAKGTKIWHFSHILPGSEVGENCNIGQNCVIGPDVAIGNKCKLQNNVSVYKGVTLEDGVFCGPSMVFTNIFNPRAEISKMSQVRPTLVKKGATIGANATIICGHTIGRYAFIGAGAVVTKDVPDHALMAGNPARQIGWACECGEKLANDLQCEVCSRKYNQTEKFLSFQEMSTADPTKR